MGRLVFYIFKKFKSCRHFYQSGRFIAAGSESSAKRDDGERSRSFQPAGSAGCQRFSWRNTKCESDFARRHRGGVPVCVADLGRHEQGRGSIAGIWIIDGMVFGISRWRRVDGALAHTRGSARNDRATIGCRPGTNRGIDSRHLLGGYPCGRHYFNRNIARGRNNE